MFLFVPVDNTREKQSVCRADVPPVIPPTHNREPYDTRLSDTMVTHPLSPIARWRRSARTAAASASSSSQSGGATKLTLHGGVPHHPALAGLW